MNNWLRLINNDSAHLVLWTNVFGHLVCVNPLHFIIYQSLLDGIKLFVPCNFWGGEGEAGLMWFRVVIPKDDLGLLNLSPISSTRNTSVCLDCVNLALAIRP